MSDTDTVNTEAGFEELMPDELTFLKNRARLMGIVFSNNISIPTLKAKIEAHVEGKADPTKEANPLSGESTAPVKEISIRDHLKKECEKLVRLRITNLDPKKKDLPGEIFTVANDYLGTIKKFVPYGEVTDEGYHVPNIIYEMMLARRFLDIRTTRDPRTGSERVGQRWVKEFALEVLPQLTKEELNRLAATQAAAGFGSEE